MKGKIIYSLTNRGLFSELTNLALAKVYADFHNKELLVNTTNWNAKIKNGWEDYFKKTVTCINNICSAQLKIYTKEKPWLGKIYYKPSEFFSFYFYFYLNAIYKIIHNNTELTKDVFPKMRSQIFLKVELEGQIFSFISSAFKSMYKYNDKVGLFIKNEKQNLCLPNDYIGIHIRRGDKIISKEMNEIRINKYIDEIINRKNISSNVFIATDDTSVLEQIQSILLTNGITTYYNKTNIQQGFDETTFNQKNEDTRYSETLNMMLDMDILCHSTFFIGTYTSNVSRVVPFYIGLDNCISLDKEWDILNS